jgi:hypothetical protein
MPVHDHGDSFGYSVQEHPFLARELPTMTTITLVQAAAHEANRVHSMTARPMNVNLVGLAGGAIQFTCTNALAAVQGATSVEITYAAPFNPQRETVQVSSVML